MNTMDVRKQWLWTILIMAQIQIITSSQLIDENEMVVSTVDYRQHLNEEIRNAIQLQTESVLDDATTVTSRLQTEPDLGDETTVSTRLQTEPDLGDETTVTTGLQTEPVLDETTVTIGLQTEPVLRDETTITTGLQTEHVLGDETTVTAILQTEPVLGDETTVTTGLQTEPVLGDETTVTTELHTKYVSIDGNSNADTSELSVITRTTGKNSRYLASFPSTGTTSPHDGITSDTGAVGSNTTEETAVANVTTSLFTIVTSATVSDVITSDSDITTSAVSDVNASAVSNVTDTNLRKNASLNLFGKYVTYVITPVLVCVGMFGNTMSLIVMQSKAFSHMSMGLILSGLSVSDTIVLLMHPFTKPWLIHLMGMDVRAMSDESCKLFFIIIRTAKMCSSWFIVLVCLERLIAVYFPFRAKLINTKRHTIAAMFVIFTALLIFNGFWSFSSKVDDDKNCLAHKSEPSIKSRVISMTGLITYGVMPTLLLSTMTPAIIFRIVQKANKRRKLTSVVQHKTDQNQKTAAMLFSVTVAYILLAIPISVMYVTSITRGEKPYSSSDPLLTVMREIAQSLELLNYSINFYLYVASSQMFRSRLASIFGCKIISSMDQP